MSKVSRHQSVSKNEASMTTGQFEELVTAEELAPRLGLEPPQVYELTRKRCRDPLPRLKVGKFLRFRLSSVEAWLKRRAA